MHAEDVAFDAKAWFDPQDAMGSIQRVIGEVGTLALRIAEELRRPTGDETHFIAPLALYRQIR